MDSVTSRQGGQAQLQQYQSEQKSPIHSDTHHNNVRLFLPLMCECRMMLTFVSQDGIFQKDTSSGSRAKSQRPNVWKKIKRFL
jgi:hypothetical protein